jgi:hypothetical protein
MDRTLVSCTIIKQVKATTTATKGDNSITSKVTIANK